MPSIVTQARRFFRFEGVPMEVVLATALASYVLQIYAIQSDKPLYLIAFYTLLPWIPLCTFEGIWKVRNYSMIALLGVFTVLQLGHFAEHLIQVIQIKMLDGTVACPPPVDNLANAARAVALGLRDAALEPTFLSVDAIAKPGPDGQPLLEDNGDFVTGPAACAVFGQLDLEVVHLVWELVGYFGTAFVLLSFPRNRWLLVAFLFLCWHALEHLTITYFYYFDQDALWPGQLQQWATVQIEGARFLAVPAGKIDAMLNFYQAGGKFGLMAKNGFFELATGFDGMPSRAVLHMGYNLAITIPTVIGFLIELRGLRSRYLEQMFGDLSPDQLADLSTRVKDVTFPAGALILREGDPATNCYLVKEGEIGIYLDYGAPDQRLIARISSGALLGEMGLLDGKARSATAIALKSSECLELDAVVFTELTDVERGRYGSEATVANIRRIAEERQRANVAAIA